MVINKRFDRIYPEEIKEKHPNSCSKCKQRTNQIIVQTKPINKKVIQYLKCPICHTQLAKRVLIVIREFNMNPNIILKENAKS